MYRYLTILGLLVTVAWFFWNPTENWEIDLEPIAAFFLALAGFIHSEKKSRDGDFHDKELFDEFLKLLPSTESIDFVRNHDFLSSFRIEELSPVQEFRRRWDNAEHKFNNKKLENARSSLYKKVETFLVNIAQYTSPNKFGLQAVRHDSVRHDPVHEKRFAEEAKIINISAKELVGEHQRLVELGCKVLRK